MTPMPDDISRRMRFILELRQLGITDARVLSAVELTSRSAFAAPHLEQLAWDDVGLPLECGQVLTKPSVVAQAVNALQPGLSDHILEIGTGSGYQSAILSQLAGRITSIERYRTLALSARDRLAEMGVRNVRIHLADGAHGLPEDAPFDRIIVNCAVAAPPQALFDQLSPRGVLVAPVGAGGVQRLQRYARRADGALAVEDYGPARFMPLEEGVAQEL